MMFLCKCHFLVSCLFGGSVPWTGVSYSQQRQSWCSAVKASTRGTCCSNSNSSYYACSGAFSNLPESLKSSGDLMLINDSFFNESLISIK